MSFFNFIPFMNRYLNIAVPILLFLFLMTMLPYLPGMEFDVRTGFQAWAVYIHQNGLRNAYGATDYMPVYQYIMWLFGKIMGTDQGIVDHISMLRCFTLLFDFAGIWYVYKWIDKKVAYFAILAVSILNVGYVYDSIIWGQVDGILSALVFISMYYGHKRNNLLSTIFLVIAFNFKIQSVVIVPVWGLLFLGNIQRERKTATILFPILAAIAVQVLLVFPFTRGNYGLHQIYAIATDSFGKFHSVSIKASNMWHWFVKGYLIYADDMKPWILGLSYKTVGLLLFFGTSFFALLPMMLLLYKQWKTGNERYKPGREMVWLTCAVLYLLFYFVNTEIHERYCQPAFIFITAYAFYTGRFASYAVFSIMYFLTLEVSMQHFHLPNYETLIFDFKFLAGLTAFVLADLSWKLHKQYKAVLNSSD